MAWLIVGIAEWVGAPFPGFLVLENGVVASAGLTHWPALSDASIFQSKILSYDGITYSDPITFNAYVASKPIGSPVAYAFESRSEIFDRTIQTRRFESSDAFLLFGVTLFSAIALLSVSLSIDLYRTQGPLEHWLRDSTRHHRLIRTHRGRPLRTIQVLSDPRIRRILLGRRRNTHVARVSPSEANLQGPLLDPFSSPMQHRHRSAY